MPATTCDPSGLANLARCYRCLDAGTLVQVETFLLCQWANGHPTPPPPTGIGYTIVSSFGWESGTLLNSFDYFFGGDLFNSAQVGQGGGPQFSFNRVKIPFSGTLKRHFVKVRLAGTGTGETVQHFIRLNDTTDFAEVDLAWTAVEVHGTNASVNQAVVQGDEICFKLTTPNWGVAPTGRRIWMCAYIEP